MSFRGMGKKAVAILCALSMDISVFQDVPEKAIR